MNSLVRCVALLWCAAVLATTTTAQTTGYDWTTSTSIAGGVEYVRTRVAVPRPQHLYCMQIDTRQAGLRFHTTGRRLEWRENAEETVRTTTRDFVRESRAAGLNIIAAINADAFEPWPAPWNERTATNLRGLAISDGELVSPPSASPSFVVYHDGSVAIVDAIQDVAGIQLAVSGFAIVLDDGAPLAGNDSIHPRTGIGVSEDARYVYFLVIDGRRHASEGATTEEVGAWLMYFGAWDGINLDGGGSATIVRHDDEAEGDGVVLLNNPVGNGVNWLERDASDEASSFAPTERANGNNLGVCVEAE